jgi:hypothetical protein
MENDNRDVVDIRYRERKESWRLRCNALIDLKGAIFNDPSQDREACLAQLQHRMRDCHELVTRS